MMLMNSWQSDLIYLAEGCGGVLLLLSSSFRKYICSVKKIVSEKIMFT